MPFPLPPSPRLACPPPFWPSLYSIRPLQSRRRLPFVNWSFASSPADGRAVQCRDANAIRPPSSPSEAVAKPDHGSASHHGTERTDHGSSHGVDYCGVDQSTGLELE